MSDAKSIWLEILEWHRTQHGKDLAAAFELGDFIIRAVILTGLKKEQVIRKIRLEFSDLAFSCSRYRRATQLATVYTPNQREVLITRGVSYIRAVKLAGEEFNATRVKTIIEIKAGRLTKWGQIKSKLERKHLKETKTLREGLRFPEDVIAIKIREHGQFQHDLAEPGVISLVGQMPQDMLLELLNKGVEYWARRGKEVKRFKI